MLNFNGTLCFIIICDNLRYPNKNYEINNNTHLKKTFKSNLLSLLIHKSSLVSKLSKTYSNETSLTKGLRFKYSAFFCIRQKQIIVHL